MGGYGGHKVWSKNYTGVTIPFTLPYIKALNGPTSTPVSTPSTAPTATATPLPPVMPQATSCVDTDKQNLCGKKLAQGKCDEGYAQRKCKQTCGLCDTDASASIQLDEESVAQDDYCGNYKLL